MALDRPELVMLRLHDAREYLSEAHRSAGESDGDRHDLNGPVRDAIFGLNTVIDALIQMLDESLEHAS